MSKHATGRIYTYEDAKGELITDIETIIQLAKDKKCIWYRGGRSPAAFVAHFQAMHLWNEIQQKVIFYYKSQGNDQKAI